MNTEEITGGVSPMKKKWKGKASRGKGGQKRSIKGKLAGSAGIRNTSTRRGRRGFSKAGAKGVNVHGYGALTRFKPHTYKGPLAPATTPKTGSGGSGGSGGGGGGDTIDNSTTTYNIDSHDRIDNRRVEIGNIDTSATTNIENKPKITNETNTEINQKNVNKTKQKLESYDNFWNKRIKSGKHSAGMKKYIKKHGGDLVKARKEWEYVSRKYAHIRNKNRQSNTANVDNTSDQSGAGVSNVTKGGAVNLGDATKFMTSKSIAGYNPKLRSPNKMRSHAWDMLQKQKKARGGTQK